MPRVEMPDTSARPVECVLGGLRCWLRPGYAQVLVPSVSKPGQMHTVYVRDGLAMCGCRGFRYRGTCAHADRVKPLVCFIPAGGSGAAPDLYGTMTYGGQAQTA